MNSELDWSERPPPALPQRRGRFVAIEPAIFPEAAEALFSVLGGPGNDDLWTYIPFGPFKSTAALGAAMAAAGKKGGWLTHLFRDAQTGAPLGMASYMRIRPEAGSAEVGCVVFSKKLQKTPAATEAMYLMAKHVFDDLGYRRYEWKCDNANEASKRAARRLGFSFEGVFRQDLVVKGRNRDTAWFSIIDGEWPQAKAAFEVWLAPENFDDEGRQRCPLRA
ncbi:GNAT family N-acetyltransferase [Hyphococcus luteus]|uniref:GNAT family N-acetyltransferase n=1 Tax=Hyphococcus luteus TaxID=2058213 RepID=A0A2S7K8N8_9PROT|nr:GNAT family protein [Marinicaulis flavus]PQA88848.1 GNAT family N-acetyltransferase [Marinicaulis flavus]